MAENKELEVDDVKLYLGYSSDTVLDEGTTLMIQSLIDFSIEYIKNGTGLDKQDSELYRLAQKIIISDRFNNRGSRILSKSSENSLIPIMLQLKNCYENK